MTWYHGGPAGIRGLILPASVTGVRNATDLCPELDTQHVRRDRVFLTNSLIHALMFASVQERPMIYEVEPLGELEPDPDFQASDEVEHVQTTYARIVRRHRPPYGAVIRARLALAQQEE